MRNIDELNNTKRRSIPYEEYFGEMELTEEQIKNRIDMSNDIENEVLFLFALILLSQQYSYFNAYFVQNEFRNRIGEILLKYQIDEEFSQIYVEQLSKEIYDSTINNAFGDEAEITANREVISESDSYYLSDDRAMFIAENEANTIYNNQEYLEAIENGKTMKTWIDMKDKHVRKTHRKLSDKTIPITEFFNVGKAVMRFPKDIEFADDVPEEIINCRCSIKYF